MADKETTRLCIQIVQDQFGTTPARVAAELLSRGRLRLAHIVRSTSIRPRAAANAILILIQHNILWHCESVVEGEMFEVNWEEVLARLRFGRYISIARDLFGEPAVDILSFIMDHGKVRAGEIVPSLITGINTKNTTLYNSILISLLKSMYIKPTSAALQISPRDRLIRYQEEAERAKRASAGAKKGPLAAKDLLEVRELARRRLKEEVDSIEGGGFRRRAKDAKETLTSRTIKRQKIDEDVLDEDVYLRVNYAKFNLHIRNRLIEQSASQRYNESAGLVIRAALAAGLPSESTLHDVRSEILTVQNIMRHLPSDPPLVGIGIRPSGSGGASSMEAGTQALMTREYVNILCAADNPTEAGRQSAFMAYSGLSGAVGGGGGKKVAIEYENIGRRLRFKIFETFVRERWGELAIRVLRLLIDKGKMDEKQVAKVAMMSKKDVQPLLTKLASASLISLQEVPRGADRSAMRTIYLWYIDLAKTYSVILTSLYKTLGNILARKNAETQKVSAILSKRERSDVQGNEENFLTRGEREALTAFEEKRLRLGVLERRVEECVFILRDLAPDGYAGES